MILVEDSKVYKQWCNHSLRKKVDNVLVKKGCSTTSVEKDPDQSRVDHCWKTSTLDSYRDYCVT